MNARRLALITLAALLGAAPGASAATTTVATVPHVGQMTVTGLDLVPHDVTVYRVNDVIRVRDDGPADLAAGSGCVLAAGGAAVDCPSSIVTNVVARFGNTADRFEADPAFDLPIYVFAGDGDDTLLGGAAGDALEGHFGADTVDGRGGDDLLRGNPGPDTFIGGPGTDVADYSQTGGSTTITLDGVRNDGGVGELDLVGTDVENVYGGGAVDLITGDAGDNVLTGNNDADVIAGGGGDDVLDGGEQTDQLRGEGGEDFLVGRGGADLLDGGADEDTVSYRSSGVAVTVTLDDVANDGAAGENDDVRAETVLGGTAADTLTGSGAAETLDGGPGNDTVDAGGGDDVLVGGPGTDTLRGGADDDLLAGGDGPDLLDGEGGTDTADYSFLSLPLTVTLDAAGGDGVAGENDDVQTENVLGGSGNDTLSGDGGPNAISGGAGDDTIDGAAGDDVLTGGAGRDALTTGAGADVVAALDDEADTLTCDTAAGKVLDVDGLDDGPSCGVFPATPGSGGPPATPPLPAPAPVTLPAPPSSATARSARALTADADLLPAGTVVVLRSRGEAFDVGSLACTAGQTCAASVQLSAGKRKAKAKVTRVATARTALAAGPATVVRRLLRRGKRLTVTATITLTEGTTKVVVRRRLVLLWRRR